MIFNLLNKFKRVMVAILLLPFFSRLVFALETKTPERLDPVSTSGVIQLAFGLAIVVMLIFMISWLVKRVSGFSVYSNPHLKVISGLHVGQKEKILLIQIADKQIVVGVTASSIRTLHQLESNIINDDTSMRDNIPFAERLLQALKKEKK